MKLRKLAIAIINPATCETESKNMERMFDSFVKKYF